MQIIGSETIAKAHDKQGFPELARINRLTTREARKVLIAVMVFEPNLFESEMADIEDLRNEEE